MKACARSDANLENLDEIRKLIQDHRPEVIINAAAYTAVDLAEYEQEKAYQINSEAVAVLANEAKRINSWLIHIAWAEPHLKIKWPVSGSPIFS